MKIVILDGYTENPGDLSWNGFEALGEVTVYDRTPFADGSGEIVRRAKGADILIVNKTPLSAETLAKLAPELRYIGVLATGYNVVDTAAAKAQGVPVCNIPTYGTAAVAQFVMALLLELCHHVGDHSRSVKEGGWSSCPDFCYWNTPLIELAGKTFGVIGYGRIGRAAAKLAAAFGMEVLAFDKFAQDDGVARMVTLDELLAQSDVISLHCPLFLDTQGHHQPGEHCKDEGWRTAHQYLPRAPDRGGGPGCGAAQRQGGGRGPGCSGCGACAHG